MTGEEAKELMERGGFVCELIDNGTVPFVHHPPSPTEKTRLIVYAGEHGLACHIYPRGIILVPIRAALAMGTKQILAQGSDFVDELLRIAEGKK